MQLDKFEIDERSTTPIWLQLKNRLIFLITSGALAPGEKLPTVRELAVVLKVNYNTVNKVYLSLLHDGYLTARRGKGTFVCDVTKAGPMEDSPADGVIDMMIKQCLDLGVPVDDIAEQVAKRVERYKESQDGLRKVES